VATRSFFGVGTRLNEVVGWVLLGLLAVGCVLVLRPFFSSLLWAIILVFSTWPLQRQLKAFLGGHNLSAALLMTLVLAAMLVVPMVLLATALAESAEEIVNRLRDYWETGEGLGEPPGWLLGWPIIGDLLGDTWRGTVTTTGDLFSALGPYLAPFGDAAIRGGLGIGRGVLELVVSVLVAFFIYRDGEHAAGLLQQSVFSVVGERAQHLIEVAAGTVRSVVYGVIGTAMIQGILLFFGLWVAGVPEPFLLATLTFILGLFPVAGSSLVWVPAGIWLLYGGHLFAGVFIMAYGVLIVGAVDNVLKPYLISRGSKLPFLLVFFGILGGVMTFGILGLFLGPVLLALGLALTREWLEMQAERVERDDDAAPDLDRGSVVGRDSREN